MILHLPVSYATGVDVRCPIVIAREISRVPEARLVGPPQQWVSFKPPGQGSVGNKKSTPAAGQLELRGSISFHVNLDAKACTKTSS